MRSLQSIQQCVCSLDSRVLELEGSVEQVAESGITLITSDQVVLTNGVNSDVNITTLNPGKWIIICTTIFDLSGCTSTSREQYILVGGFINSYAIDIGNVSSFTGSSSVQASTIIDIASPTAIAARLNISFSVGTVTAVVSTRITRLV